MFVDIKKRLPSKILKIKRTGKKVFEVAQVNLAMSKTII